MSLTETIVHEDGDLVYLIAPVSPIEPSDQEIEEFAYGTSIVTEAAQRSPNPFIKWYGGHYVEADHPNGNGAMWTAKEIALKSLTPRFMPVTVMHDPTSAVGLIADVALRTPEADKVPRSKLDTALALWGHRFPEVVEEAQLNYSLGSLMQSMECLAPSYECAACGMGFLKLPHGAERANWCAHLKGEDGTAPASRILRATTFTGTGLIFGTRGATGADPMAHLEDFKQEVAEFHQRGAASAAKRPSPRSKPTMEITIDKAEYDALQARPTGDSLDTERARADHAEKEFERVEAENVSLRKTVEDKDTEIAGFKEQANQTELRTERMGRLGDKFLAALGEKTKSRLEEQAAKMQDAEWNERVEELADLVKVKSDERSDGSATETAAGSGTPAPGAGTPTFTAEELARQQVRGSDLPTPEPTVSRNIIAGLISRPTRAAK